MRKAVVVVVLSLGSARVTGMLHAQDTSVKLWITTSDEAGVVAGLEAQSRLAFRAVHDDAPAAIKVDDSTENPDILNVAFKDPNGSMVLIAYNNTATPQNFKVRWRSKSFSYILPVITTVTFRWNANEQ